MSPFERGKKAGKWTKEQLQESKFTSARACLEKQESVYREAMAELSRAKDPIDQEQYLKGFIAGARESLSKLL